MKKYRKPVATSQQDSVNIAPALAVGAALAGGYVIGRVVKAIEARPDFIAIKQLRKVHLVNECGV